MQQLLPRDDLDLKKTIKICRSYEQANRQSEEMKKESQASIHKVSESKHTCKPNRKLLNKGMNASHKRPMNRKPPNKVKMCKFCGKKTCR